MHITTIFGSKVSIIIIKYNIIYINLQVAGIFVNVPKSHFENFFPRKSSKWTSNMTQPCGDADRHYPGRLELKFVKEIIY